MATGSYVGTEKYRIDSDICLATDGPTSTGRVRHRKARTYPLKREPIEAGRLARKQSFSIGNCMQIETHCPLIEDSI